MQVGLNLCLPLRRPRTIAILEMDFHSSGLTLQNRGTDERGGDRDGLLPTNENSGVETGIFSLLIYSILFCLDENQEQILPRFSEIPRTLNLESDE